MTEARVLRGGLNITIQVGFHNRIVEGDNKTIIQILEGIIQIHAKFRTSPMTSSLGEIKEFNLL